jgi:adenosylhomocysteine nucleosidase
VVALPAEGRTVIRQRLTFDTLQELPGGHWLTVSGAGPGRAGEAANRLLDREVDGLVSWGCAAATVHHLRPGHLILPALILGENGESHPADPAWRARLSIRMPEELVSHAGPLRESATVVPTHAAKTAIHAATGSIAVDMESGAIARTALANNLPFLAIRAIADPAAMDFPGAVSRALNPRGDVRILTLLAQLARHPREAGELIALGRAFGAALRTLHRVRRAAGPDFGFTARP